MLSRLNTSNRRFPRASLMGTLLLGAAVFAVPGVAPPPAAGQEKPSADKDKQPEAKSDDQQPSDLLKQIEDLKTQISRLRSEANTLKAREADSRRRAEAALQQAAAQRNVAENRLADALAAYEKLSNSYKSRPKAASTGPRPRKTAESTGAAAPASPALAGSAVPLDLVNLANSYSQALAEMKISRARRESAAELARTRVGSRADVVIAEAQLEAAVSRAELLKKIIEHTLNAEKTALKSAKQRHQQLLQLYNTGAIASTEVHAAEDRLRTSAGRIEILELILKSK